ncbi:MAG: hypothetical protein GX303_07270 [Clostridiales bacterium]|nr:hypothetical protein [Clostridiales bacterium]
MKKYLSIVLFAIIISLMIAPSASAAKPIGNALSELTAVPDENKNLSSGLLASSPEYSKTSFAANSLTADQIADIAKISYGVSLIGATGLERTVAGATDGVWSSGNTGEELLNGKKAQGALSFYANFADGAYITYNVKGETGKSDSIYKALLTYNLGQKKTLEALAFMSTSLNGFPQSGDVYVSDNGTDWTLVGSWDRCAKRLAGGDYTNLIDTEKTNSPEDIIGGKISTMVGFSLSGSGQYVRFGFIKGAGVTDGNGTYDGFANSDTENKTIAIREIAVYGRDYDASVTTVTTTAASTTAPVTGNNGIYYVVAMFIFASTIVGFSISKKRLAR